MSDLYAFICTKTTADFIVPATALSEGDWRRKVSLAFAGLVGGYMTVGDIKFRPSQAALANHLLCDGSTISRDQFPLLVDYLAGPTATEAVLPVPPFSFPAPTVTQTTTGGGTVSTGGTVSDAGDTGGTTGGNVPSGGRPDRIDYR